MNKNNKNTNINNILNGIELAEMEINLSYALNRHDLFWYNLYFARFLVAGFLVFLFLFIAVFIWAVKTPLGDLATTLIWVEVGLGIGLSICAGSIASIALQVYLVKNETITKAMTKRNYIINTAGIAVFDDRSKIVRTWKDVVKVNKSRQGFYIRTSGKLAIIIPRRELSDPVKLKTLEKIVKNCT